MLMANNSSRTQDIREKRRFSHSPRLGGLPVLLHCQPSFAESTVMSGHSFVELHVTRFIESNVVELRSVSLDIRIV